jgi:hypothetical protein
VAIVLEINRVRWVQPELMGIADGVEGDKMEKGMMRGRKEAKA